MHKNQFDAVMLTAAEIEQVSGGDTGKNPDSLPITPAPILLKMAASQYSAATEPSPTSR